MKRKIIFRLSLFFGLFAVLNSCTKEGYVPIQNDYLKKIKQGEYITAQYTYNQDNLILEVNSTSFYRKFYYDNSKKLIKEEVAFSPDSYSSSMPAGMTHEFVDPDKTGISMYSVYEYNDNGDLLKQLNYIPKSGLDELRSIRIFEYENDRISKVLLQNSEEVVTQFSTFQYDYNGNVIEQNYFTYLFIPEGTGPTHLSRTTFEYDSYFNPYAIFKQTGIPGIHSNLNNIIKTKSINYDLSPGIPDNSESETTYKYNKETRYPVKVINGEEFIYD